MATKVSILIDLVGRVFANGPGDFCLIPGRIIPETLKMVLDTSLLNTRQYKVRVKGKVEQFRERSSAHPYPSVSKLLKREPSGCPRLRLLTLQTNFVWKSSEIFWDTDISSFSLSFHYSYIFLFAWMVNNWEIIFLFLFIEL